MDRQRGLKFGFFMDVKSALKFIEPETVSARSHAEVVGFEDFLADAHQFLDHGIDGIMTIGAFGARWAAISDVVTPAEEWTGRAIFKIRARPPVWASFEDFEDTEPKEWKFASFSSGNEFRHGAAGSVPGGGHDG